VLTGWIIGDYRGRSMVKKAMAYHGVIHRRRESKIGRILRGQEY